MWLLNWQIPPETGMGRADLPVEVGAWLPAVAAAVDKAAREAARS
jgi:hypothetical protein